MLKDLHEHNSIISTSPGHQGFLCPSIGSPVSTRHQLSSNYPYQPWVLNQPTNQKSSPLLHNSSSLLIALRSSSLNSSLSEFKLHAFLRLFTVDSDKRRSLPPLLPSPSPAPPLPLPLFLPAAIVAASQLLGQCGNRGRPAGSGLLRRM